jgi:hypothetical protein
MKPHAGKHVVSRRKAARIVERVDTTGKPRVIEIMRELEPDLTKKAAGEAYDRVTRAINGWVNAYTRDLPRGLHARLLLTNCFSVNLCWTRSVPGKRPELPQVWVTLGDRYGRPGPRGNMRRMRLRAWARFYEDQGRPR